MSTKKQMADQLGLNPADYKHAELAELVKAAAGDEKSQETSELKAHEVEAFEKIVRKAVKRDDTGFRKGVSDKDKAAAKVALKILGRKTITWDHSLNLNYIDTAKTI